MTDQTRKQYWMRGLAGLLTGSLLLAALLTGAPPPAQAQATNCTFPTTVTATPTTTTAAATAAAQSVRFNAQQKQALCQAAEALERQNVAVAQDLSSALLPGSLGPVGPLAITDLLAQRGGPEASAAFTQTVAATAAGFSSSISLNGGIVGYLHALTEDSIDTNYQVVMQPVIPPVVFPSVAPETNVPVAATFQTLLVNESQAFGTA